MNRIKKISLTLFSATLLTGAALALPSHAAHAANAQAPSGGAPTQQEMQASGKITSVSGKTFTLAASQKSSSSATQQFQSQDGAQPMTFIIDDQTTVSGKLAVGANAEVTYRTQGGQNVAVSVRVSS